MIQAEMAYICDVCNKKVSKSCEIIETKVDGYWQYPEISDPGLPEGWKEIGNYGLCCDRCVSEFDSLFERIHSPIKAKEIRRDI